MIKKRLLEIVLNKNITYLSDVTDNKLPYQESGKEGWQTINLDTLNRLYKEFCLNNGYRLHGYQSQSQATFEVINEDKFIDFCETTITNENELDAVFKATIWVAKKKKLL